MACVYVSTRMNACIRAVEPTFGLWAADLFAGVHVCMRACRHGQSTVVMTPVSLSISGFSSSSFDKQNRKCLLGEQMLCQLEKKWKNATWRPCCWLKYHPKVSPKGHENISLSCPSKFNTVGPSSVGHGSLHQISQQCIQQERNRWRMSTAAKMSGSHKYNMSR